MTRTRLIERLAQVQLLQVVGLPRQLAIAGGTEDLTCHAMQIGELARGHTHFTQNRTRAQEPDAPHRIRCARLDHFKPIQALQQIRVHVLGQTGHCMVFIHQRDVVKLVLLFDQHPLHPMFQNDRHLARMRRIPGPAIRDRTGDQKARAILMLQAFAAQRGAASGGTKEETPRALVGCGPDQIAHALKSEHRVVDVDR